MAPPEANFEMVLLARNLPNDCIDFSIPGSSARDETALAILLSEHQRAKIGKARLLHTKLKTDKLAANGEIPRRAKPRLCYLSKHNGSPGGGGALSMGSNIVTSLAPGETL